MRRRVFKAGNSLVISLPADWVRDQGLREGGDVRVQVSDAGALEIRPILDDPPVSVEFAQHVEEFIDSHRDILDQLARR